MVAMFCAEQLLRRHRSKKQPSDYELRFLLFPENVDFGEEEQRIECPKSGSLPPDNRFNCRLTRQRMPKRSELCNGRRARSKSNRHFFRVVVSFPGDLFLGTRL
jgi:hypothetical protein